MAPAVEHHARPGALQDVVPAGRQGQRRAARPRVATDHAGGVLEQRDRGRVADLHAVVEEREPAVRTCHGLEPARHAAGGRGQRRQLGVRQRHTGSRRAGERHAVEQVLQHEGVVERAPLDVAAVLQHLSRNLRPQERARLSAPPGPLGVVEQEPEHEERPGVLDQVVAPEVVFEVAGQEAALRGERGDQRREPPLGFDRRREGAQGRRPARHAQGERIGLPAGATPGRVGADPVVDERPRPLGGPRVETLARRQRERGDVLAVVKVVPPQARHAGRAPVDGSATALEGLLQEGEAPGGGLGRPLALPSRRGTRELAGHPARQDRQRLRVRARGRGQTEARHGGDAVVDAQASVGPGAPQDLAGRDVAQRAHEPRHVRDAHIAGTSTGVPRRIDSRAAKVAPVVAASSANGIGSGPPARTAARKAASSSR